MFKYFLVAIMLLLWSACKITSYKSCYYEVHKDERSEWNNATQSYKVVSTYKHKKRYELLIGNGVGKNKYFEVQCPQYDFGGEKYPSINIYGRLENNKLQYVPFSMGYLSISELNPLTLDTLPKTFPFDLPELYEIENRYNNVLNNSYFPIIGNDNGREPNFFFITINPHREDSFYFYPKIFQKNNNYLDNADSIFLKELKYCLRIENAEIRGTIYPTDTIEWFKITVCTDIVPILQVGVFGNAIFTGEYFYKSKKNTNSLFKGELVSNKDIYGTRNIIYLDSAISNIRIQKHLFGRLTLLYDKEQQTHKIRFKPTFIRPRYKKYYREKMAYVEKNTELYEAYQAQQLEYEQLIKNKK